uniref:Allergen Lep d 3 n=1 Tax=Lepidoglyphus destructor TaxID=36936 RepID=Q1M2L7_LEPDS|nr:allergen Lep d 3 [Lepidoglyphus destructor]
MKFLVLLCLVSAAIAGPLSDLKPRYLVASKFGQTKDSKDGYIVGGSAVASGEATYQVSLQRSSHFCGGTIIDDYWVLTAAHCVSGTSASQLKVRYNTVRHNSGGSLISVSEVIAHSGYSSWTLDNDIALLKTSSPMTGIKKADLPVSGSDVSGSVLVTGWGYTTEGGSLASSLQKVSVPVVDRAQCNSSYSGDITPNMFCAGVSAGGKDSCQGDSGGPVVSGNTVVGAVSWGMGCARPNYPGVYTRVGNFREWIKTNSGL